MKTQAIGLYGGAFDPVHHGHLRIALEVQQVLQLAAVRWLPCRTPVLKEACGATGEQRLAMLQLALADSPGFVIDDRELTREGPSYSIDSVMAIRREFPDVPLCFIMGLDAFLDLPAWHRWRELLDYVHLVVTTRPGKSFSPEPELQRYLSEHQLDDMSGLHENKAGFIYIQTVTALDISATVIRHQIHAGYSPQFLLPEAVWQYIQREQLYQ